ELAGDGDDELSIPLDLRGTTFQERVWQALRRIPKGQTLSYTEVAQSIGKPSATRAVASAIAKNRIAVVVPCHRVIRGDGSLGGYRWGLATKDRLLNPEKSKRAAKRWGRGAGTLKSQPLAK